ncbi:MAG: type II toxin-antitoxin system YhaV family toxin [Halieaceae bacterium]|jgi:toxin YhaV|nr:type II toxin-antitoxin system YhaV family toxin [Halieaceae bacterium]
MQCHGWTLLFHPCIVEQLEKLHSAAARAAQKDPQTASKNANVKVYRALAHLLLEVIPADPSHERFRQGKTLGSEHRHWRRAKFGGRFRLFFRYSAASKVIVYAWVNDTHTQRAAGSKSDPYSQFRAMLMRGHPPTTWNELVSASSSGASCLVNTDPTNDKPTTTKD